MVTGGGRGLGRAIALALTARGARVAVAARTATDVAAVAAEVGGLAVRVDVSQPTEIARMVSEVTDNVGPVDVLVNNAGVIWPLGRTWLIDPDEWERALTINLVGAVRCISAVLPGMLERGYGRVLNISSGAALGAGMPSASAYSAGKAGLDMVTANLAADLHGTGVTVTGVRPGTVDTPMQDYMRSLPPEQVGTPFFERFAALHRDGALIDPVVPARLVARLLESDRSGITIDVRSDEGRALVAD